MLDQRCCGAEHTEAGGALLLGCSVGARGDVVFNAFALCVDGTVAGELSGSWKEGWRGRETYPHFGKGQ